MSRATKYEYNNVGELTQVDYPSDTDVIYGLDNLGRMTSRVDSAGTWIWTYQDQSSRVLSESLFVPSLTSVLSVVNYSYSSNTFELAKVSLDSSHYTEYFWSMGRLTNVVSVCGEITNSFSYSYVPNSDLLSGISNLIFEITRA